MVTEAPSIARVRRLRERRSRGVAMVAPVEVGQGGIALLVGNGLLKEHETRDRKAVGKACLAALEQWSMPPLPATTPRLDLPFVLTGVTSVSCVMLLL